MVDCYNPSAICDEGGRYLSCFVQLSVRVPSGFPVKYVKCKTILYRKVQTLVKCTILWHFVNIYCICFAHLCLSLNICIEEVLSLSHH